MSPNTGTPTSTPPDHLDRVDGEIRDVELQDALTSSVGAEPGPGPPTTWVVVTGEHGSPGSEDTPRVGGREVVREGRVFLTQVHT